MSTSAISAELDVVGIGEYANSITRKFVIGPYPDISALIEGGGSVRLLEGPYIYDGSAHTPRVEVIGVWKGETVILKEGTDYAVFYRDNVNAGTGMVEIRGRGVYQGSRFGQAFSITKMDLAQCTLAVDDARIIFEGGEVDIVASARVVNPQAKTEDASVLIEKVDYELVTVSSGVGQRAMIVARAPANAQNYTGVTRPTYLGSGPSAGSGGGVGGGSGTGSGRSSGDGSGDGVGTGGGSGSIATGFGSAGVGGAFLTSEAFGNGGDSQTASEAAGGGGGGQGGARITMLRNIASADVVVVEPPMEWQLVLAGATVFLIAGAYYAKFRFRRQLKMPRRVKAGQSGGVVASVITMATDE
jgi:hypothetical protein